MNHVRKPCVFVLMAGLLLASVGGAERFEVKSPDGRLNVEVLTSPTVRYSVRLDGRLLSGPNHLSMTLQDDRVLGEDTRVLRSDTRTVNDVIEPAVPIKNSIIEDHYNELTMTFAGSYAVIFRVYDDGFAYRFATTIDEPITVMTETIEYNFNRDHKVYFPEEDSFYSHQERVYLHVPMSEIGEGRFSSIPAVVEAEVGVKLAITEADLSDYPGFYLAGLGREAMKAIFPAVAIKEEKTSDRGIRVLERADYIAQTTGTRSFPWRVMVVARQDGDLVASEMVYKLAAPNKLDDTSWIKPGKVAWDWYNANNIIGVDFRAGVNTETYKYYIDFASKYGIEYIILDEGWYPLDRNTGEHDVMQVVADMDMPALLAYAEKKNVGIIPWITWLALEENMEPLMDRFVEWGVAGIKVDFMRRDDQWMVNWYERVLIEAAKRKLFINFHGNFKPTGWQRTYPHLLTSEGVRGNENNKWSEDITPEHTLTIPFIRMLAGPMDFTPGAMRNAQTPVPSHDYRFSGGGRIQRNFRDIFHRPMSQGTRCRQLAMFVLYESPLQMLCDSPTHYLREPEVMEFLAPVPAVWHQSVVLDAKITEYLSMARRVEEEWYIGGMTDRNAREMVVDFAFLSGGTYTLTLFKDGINADRWAEDYKKVVHTVKAGDKLTISLAPGGGFAGRLVLQ